MAGGATGTAGIELRADNGSGLPTGPVLGSGTFQMVDQVGWQGAELDTPVPVIAGQTYYIVYQPVLGSYASLADPDDAPLGVTPEAIPHYFSPNCSNWDGPYTVFCWMARFGQGQGVAVESMTWGTAKLLYK
jgi:hypothetical protein